MLHRYYAALAEKERPLILERTKVALAANRRTFHNLSIREISASHVAYGSSASFWRCPRHVCFHPNSGGKADIALLPRQFLLRQCVYSPPPIAWHSRSSHLSTLTVAEWLCGASDRLDPPGVP